MKQSALFTKTIKEDPREEKSINAKLLERAGFVDKLMAGAYSYLPLGFIVLKKIENIIREEIDAIGGQEVFLPTLHPKENWQKTDRFKYEEMFKVKDRSGSELGLGWTHEEIITPLVQKFAHSYKDFPVFVYQIQNKLRNEMRAKSGLLRGVEFLMKDLYSFHKDQKDLDIYYEKVKKAYFKIFKRCGLEKHTFLTFASGGDFSKEYSNEFQVIAENGEDEIYLCKNCKIGINKEIIGKENFTCLKCGNKNLEVKKSIEVGNIFKLGDRFSKHFNFFYTDEKGGKQPVLMGSYGIGLGRLMGTIVEIYNDEKGIIWPKEVSPFAVHLIQIENNAKIKSVAEKLYKDLKNSGIEVLYDERDKSAGEKFTDSDLIGIPLRLVVSERTLKENSVELKKRTDKKTILEKIPKLVKIIT